MVELLRASATQKWVGAPARLINEKKQIPAHLQQPAVVQRIMRIPKKKKLRREILNEA